MEDIKKVIGVLKHQVKCLDELPTSLVIIGVNIIVLIKNQGLM